MYIYTHIYLYTYITLACLNIGQKAIQLFTGIRNQLHIYVKT